MRRTILFLVIVTLLGTGGNCSNETTSPPGPTRQTGIEMEPSSFWPLVSGQGFYELWLGVPAVVPGPGENPWEVEQLWTASAAFRINGEGRLVNLQGNILDRFSLPRDLDSSSIARGVISYQPSRDAGGPHPMGEWLAVGDFVAPGGTISSALSWDSDEVFDKDLRALSGSCRVRTETGEGGSTRPNGIWYFLPADVGQGVPAAPSLELDTTLPAGYIYEGWIFQRGLSSLIPLQIYPLGRFSEASGADSDGAGPFAELGPFAPFPGQDFVQGTVRDFSDGSWTTMVTIEPVLDPMPQVPSSLRVLERAIRIGDGIDLSLVLTNRAVEERLPEVMVKIIR